MVSPISSSQYHNINYLHPSPPPLSQLSPPPPSLPLPFPTITLHPSSLPPPSLSTPHHFLHHHSPPLITPSTITLHPPSFLQFVSTAWRILVWGIQGTWFISYSLPLMWKNTRYTIHPPPPTSHLPPSPLPPPLTNTNAVM